MSERKNLFNPSVKQEIIQRINTLNNGSSPIWGKMSAAQMFKHCSLILQIALQNPKHKRTIMGRIFGPLIKISVVGPKPFKKNGFTPKIFKVETEENFEVRKKELLELVQRFTPENVSDKVHPMFGLLTDEEWGQSQYKHLDHHLSQFGA